jgi:uncharacterized protein DUF4367
MNDFQNLENKLREAGQRLPYPPTPGIAPAVVNRLPRPATSRRFAGRRAWIIASLLVLLSTLMLVPPARAAILDFIQIGVVRIFRAPPAPASGNTPEIQVPATATSSAAPAPQTSPTGTAQARPLDLAGETTLSEAQTRLKSPILLPTYPTSLGPPDKVYLQDLGGSMLILIWLDAGQNGHVGMSLSEISSGSWAIEKYNPPVIQEVKVNGGRGIWTEGPYFLQERNGNYVEKRLVEGHVLVWTKGEITYRLETDLPLEEALKIAESLQPLR